METVQRISGWIPGSAEHSVIRVTDDGIELEGVVLGGSLEEPFAIRYAVMADTEGRCRGVTARTIGNPVVLELFADGKGGWTDADGQVIRELEGAIDIDLGVTPVTHALTMRRLGLDMWKAAEVSVACLDVLAGEIELAERRYKRVGADRFRVEESATGAGRECRTNEANWALEVLT
jgi:hypothetical protein